MATPSDAELEQAIKILKREQPDLGITKVRSLLKDRHAWEELSEKRVKKVMADIGSRGEAQGDPVPPEDAAGAGSAANTAKSLGPLWLEERASPRGYFTLTPVALDTGAGFPSGNVESGGVLVMLGGEYYDGNKNLFYNQLYAIDPAAKASARGTFSGGGPPARSAHQAALWEGSLFVFGGEFSSPNGGKFKLMDDMWRLTLCPAGDGARRWDKVGAKDGPSARSGHRMVAVGDRLVLYGGMGESKYFQDLHVFHLPSARWVSKAALVTQRQNGGGPQQAPGPRAGFAMWADGTDGVYVWGGTRDKGRSGSETLADLWRLDLATFIWARVPDAGPPPGPRSGVAVAVVGRRAVIFGGVSDEDVEGGNIRPRFHDDLFVFDMDTRAWSKLVPAAGKRGATGPPARRNAQCAVLGSDLLVLGGLREEGDKEREVTLDDLWALDSASLANGLLGPWRCIQALSGAGTKWFESSDDEDGEDGESGDS